MAKMGSFEVKALAHTFIGVNEEAQKKLKQIWDEFDNDLHRYERSMWVMCAILTPKENEQAQPKPQVTHSTALAIAEVLNVQKNWSCVSYAYAPNEMCFMVFIQEAEPQLITEIERKCREIVDTAGWNTSIAPIYSKNFYACLDYCMNAIEGRYISNLETKQ